MTVVVDASIALKWVLQEQGSDAAERLLEQDLTAPSLWLVEAANALLRRVVRKELTAAEAEERLAELFNAPVATVPWEEDLIEASRLAARLDHPVCDCLYLALARRLDTWVATADARFAEAVGADADLSHHVRLLSSIQR